MEVVLTILHAGGKFGGEGYKVSGGLHGVGVSVVNALSSRVEVSVFKEACSTTSPSTTARRPRSCARWARCAAATAPRWTFWPDPTIFTDTTVYDYDTLASRFREMAFLNKGLKIILHDERANPGSNAVRPRRPSRAPRCSSTPAASWDFVKFLNEGKETLNKPIYFEAENDDGTVEVAMQWSSSYSTNSVMAFANNINTHEGGTHLDGFKQAVTRTINEYARAKGIPSRRRTPTSPETTRARAARPSSR